MYMSQRDFPKTLAGVEIIRGPLNVSNATVGGVANFECILSSESTSPRWNINGIDFTVTNLPTGYEFESNSNSKVLTVNPVQQNMNNSCIYCFLLFIGGRVESTRAKLIIQSPTETSSYFTSKSPSAVIFRQKTYTLDVSTLHIPTMSSAVPTLRPNFPTGKSSTVGYSSPLIRKSNEFQ